jgi:hypothetical protein
MQDFEDEYDYPDIKHIHNERYELLAIRTIGLVESDREVRKDVALHQRNFLKSGWVKQVVIYESDAVLIYGRRYQDAGWNHRGNILPPPRHSNEFVNKFARFL